MTYDQVETSNKNHTLPLVVAAVFTVVSAATPCIVNHNTNGFTMFELLLVISMVKLFFPMTYIPAIKRL